MTHLSPDGGAMSPPSEGPALPHPLSGQMLLTLQIASRRARLVVLETEMITGCEVAALGAHSRTNATFDGDKWDRTTWRRYLAAAMRLEADYGPRMRRLRQEIGQLERLMTLLIAA
jgi:hypothetical protein